MGEGVKFKPQDCKSCEAGEGVNTILLNIDLNTFSRVDIKNIPQDYKSYDAGSL